MRSIIALVSCGRHATRSTGPVVVMISVLLADDHAVVRRGLLALLEGEPGITVVGEATDGQQALDLVAELRPDVLVLDLVMPGLSGLEVLTRLRERATAPRVVVLSMHGTDAHVADALRHGATGYVVKDASASELVLAVRRAAEGHRFLSSPLSEGRIEAYMSQPRPPADAYETLTVREREVLILAAQGLTNSDIGKQLSISRRTAESHRANLLRKLGLKGEKELIRFALKRGILEL
jgi:DNA-binding NarL/FixJ family response regulator